MIELEQFKAYEAVRSSGLTNMWAVDTVIVLAEQMTGIILTEEDVLEIIRNYNSYAEKWLVVAKQV